jgi:hypothetical protein
MAEETLVVTGYRELLRACDRAGKETKKKVRDSLRKVGDIVKRDAAGKFFVYDVHTAAGFRTVVRTRGVSVEQTLPRTTGLRPDFGALQMRKALLPALVDDEPAVEHEMQEAITTVANHFAL